MNLQPRDIKSHIFSFLPLNDIYHVTIVCKEFQTICKTKLAILQMICMLKKKYNKYDNDYENHYLNEKNEHLFKHHQLIDALCTGCDLPFARGAFDTYNLEIENDIKSIVSLIPDSVHCIMGTLRCRSGVPPLAMACFNPNIPLHIIDYLLDHGADPNLTYLLNGKPISILDDMSDNNIGRIDEIKKLFSKY